MDKYEISAFPKDKWKGTIIPMTIRSDSYYDFEIRPFDKNGCRISMVNRRSFIIRKNMIFRIHYIRNTGKMRRHTAW